MTKYQVVILIFYNFRISSLTQGQHESETNEALAMILKIQKKDVKVLFCNNNYEKFLACRPNFIDMYWLFLWAGYKIRPAYFAIDNLNGRLR